MKHESLEDLKLKADVAPLLDEPSMSRSERLERWAAVLEHHTDSLVPLLRVEHYSRQDRRALRGDRSPIAVAFADPVLRTDGLNGDTFGDALAYFGLNDRTAHRLLCDCHYRGTMTGTKVASRLRAVARGGMLRQIWDWVRPL